MKSAILLLCICALILTTSTSTQAQSEALLYLRSGQTLNGRILDVQEDTLTFESQRILHDAEFTVVRTVHQFPRNQVLCIKVSGKGSFGRVALSTLIGTAIGGGIGAISYAYADKSNRLDRLGATFALIAAPVIGSLIGLAVGLNAEPSTRVYYPALDRDYQLLCSQSRARDTTAGSKQPAPGTLSYVIDSLPLLVVKGKDGSTQSCYLLEVHNNGVRVLPDDLHLAMETAFDTSVFIPFTDIKFITNYESSGWEVGAIAGGFLLPIVLQREVDGSLPLLGAIAAGALVGGALAYWYADMTQEEWKWHPGAGDREFLRRHSLDGRFTPAPCTSVEDNP